MFRNILTLWAMSIVGAVALTLNVATNRFLFPDPSITPDFRAGDTLNVKWVSSFTRPWLQLKCQQMVTPLVKHRVSGMGSYNFTLPVWSSSKCLFELSQGTRHFASSTFHIAPTTPEYPGSLIPGMRRPPINLTTDGPDNEYILPDGTDCLDNADQYMSECWILLNITSWLPEWFLQTPQCKPGQSHAFCNIRNQTDPEPWTQTFLREADGGPGPDCTVIANTCPNSFNPDVGSLDSRLMRARYKYVRYNIIMVSRFFNSWNEAMNIAIDDAQSSISGIIDLIDKPKKRRVGLNALLTVLGLGLSFIPAIGPEFAGLTTTAITAANVALQGLQRAPGVAQAIWPVNTEDSRSVQIDELNAQMPTLRQQLQYNLEQGLKLVQGVNQSDPSTFLAFTGEGDFSVSLNNAPPTIEASMGQTIQPLLLAFTTYLASTALSENGWHALLLPGVNPAGMTNGSAGCPAWANQNGNECDGLADLNCVGYDSHGQCNGTYWWYSKSQNSAYTLNHGDKTSSTDIIQKILSRGWSTGSLLFENAAICEMKNLLYNVSSISNVNYTSLNGAAGFSYQGTFPQLDTSEILLLNSTTSFLPINGAGFSSLSTLPTYANLLYHPNNTFWKFDNDGFDLSCTSQLNTSIANSWDGSWTAHSP